MTAVDDARRRMLLRRGVVLEYVTLGWNVAGIIVLGLAAVATAVLAGLALNAGLGWWPADPLAGYALVFYAAREVRQIFGAGH